jgi:uncharacterized iron-regulated membrane protein
MHWLGDIHGNLMMGATGLMVNGIGGFLLAVLCLSGLVVWWPGIATWRRSLTIRRNVGWKRFTWDLHSATGFWTFGLVLMWGLTGAYFVFPDPFRAVINSFTPIDPPRIQQQVVASANGVPAPPPRRERRPRTRGQNILRGFSLAHYGNFAGWKTKVLWVLLGLAPPLLFVSALVMWWNRVLTPFARRLRRSRKGEPVLTGRAASAR